MFEDRYRSIRFSRSIPTGKSHLWTYHWPWRGRLREWMWKSWEKWGIRYGEDYGVVHHTGWRFCGLVRHHWDVKCWDVTQP